MKSIIYYTTYMQVINQDLVDYFYLLLKYMIIQISYNQLLLKQNIYSNNKLIIYLILGFIVKE